MIDVGSLANFADRSVTVTQAGRQEIGVIRWGEAIYAVRNACPHQAARICNGGQLRPLLVGAPEPGSMSCEDGTPVLTCPWHGWEFDLRSGVTVWKSRHRLRTYPVEVREGRVLVDITRHGSPR